MEEISRRLRAFLKKNKGISLLEIMISISILGICMAYIAYDARFSARAIYEMNEKDNMLYAAQESIERYKAGLISNKINNYSVEVKDSEEVPGVPNLKKLIVTVKPANSSMKELVIVNYAFSSTDAVPGETTNLTASPSVDHITLNWTRALNASTYSVKKKAEGDTDFEVIASGLTENVYTDEKVDKGVRYYYVVWAVNDNGAGPESNQANAIIIVTNTGLEPIADSYTQGGWFYSGDNFGDSESLFAQNGSGSKQFKSYLKFNLSEIHGTILSAKLRIYGSANKSMKAETFAVSDDSWEEMDINWSNAPSAGSSLGYLGFDGTNKYVELDVPNYCKTEMTGNQIVSFVITSPDNTKVTAVSKDATSNHPELLITWTPAMTPPAPQQLTAEPGDTKVTLSWNTVVGAESYNVKRSTTAGGPYSSSIASTSQTSYIDNAVTNGTTYYYVVTAVNSTGESNNSNQASATPDKITTISVLPAADAYVRDGAFSSTNYGTNAKLDVKNASSGSDEKRISYLRFNLSNLTGEIISAKLKLYGSNMDDSDIVNIGLYEVNDQDWDESLLTLDTAEPIGAEIGSVQVDNTQSYKEINISQYVKTAMSGTKIISVAYAGKDASRLLSFNSKENVSNKPQLVIVKTAPKPDAPLNLTAVSGNQKATLNWTQTDGAESYTLKRGTVDGGPYEAIASGITGNSYVNTGLTNGVLYYYIVTAVNTSGESPNSNQASVTPNDVATITRNPAADAKVESSNPSTNYGGNTTFQMGATSTFFSTNTRRSYLRFDVTGYSSNTPIQAKLRIYGNNSQGTMSVNAYQVSNTTWKETGSNSITWNNAPTMEAQIGSVNVGTALQYYEIDVTDYIAQQLSTSPLVSIGLAKSSSSSGLATFNSKEGTDFKPELIVDMIMGIPKVPQNLTGTGSDGKASLSWTAVSGATSYKVKGSTTKGGPYTLKAQGITGTTFEETGLTNDTAYYYVVNAVNSKGESANSNEACVIPSAG
ncbi:MAG: DNRLRE domain-containing protein, partial [Deltaproteobacteria bacterium]